MLPKYKGLKGVRVGVVHAGNGRITDCDNVDPGQNTESASASVAQPQTPLGDGLSDVETRADFRKQIVAKIKGLKQFQGFFNLAQSLDKARAMLMQDQLTVQDAGDVPWVQKILVITASKPSVWADAQRAASNIRQRGIELNFILALKNNDGNEFNIKG